MTKMLKIALAAGAFMVLTAYHPYTGEDCWYDHGSSQERNVLPAMV